MSTLLFIIGLVAVLILVGANLNAWYQDWKEEQHQNSQFTKKKGGNDDGRK
ncbi:hypothetical protein ACT26D_05950 [Megasphaera elsdenii]|uniref:hypothetical protein n=1 Tax=Megasphaera elsdenii TaxID=907 RepID=UPI004035D827